jgi:hypothetical protein
MATVAERVREQVRNTPAGAFLHTRELVESCGSRAAVEVALHRLRIEEPLVTVRRGLYFKGKPTRFGPTRPDPLQVGYEIACSAGFQAGVGPAGMSAARALGLTTQVPGWHEIAVPGRAPADVPGVHFTSRSGVGRAALRPLEVAVLEILRGWPRYSERTWPELAHAVRTLAKSGEIDLAAVQRAARRERHVAAREKADQLAVEATSST